MLAALRTLPDRQRACLVLHYYEELSIARGRGDPAHLDELGQDPLPTRTRRARITTGAHGVNVEQRLVNALRAADQVDPSPDLWSRVRALDRGGPGPPSPGRDVVRRHRRRRGRPRRRRAAERHRHPVGSAGPDPGDGTDRDDRADRPRRRPRPGHPAIRSGIRPRSVAHHSRHADRRCSACSTSPICSCSADTSC